MLGKKLKQLRLERGCTLAAVSAEVGVSVASLSKYENGVQSPGDLVLLRLANYYGMTVDELLTGYGAEGETEKRTEIRLCPWRTRRGIDQRTGNEMTWFLPCVGSQCMAYEDGACGIIKSQNIL